MRETAELTIENMLNMLEDLVNINSGSYDKEGIDQVGRYLKEIYEDIGFNVAEYSN